MASDAPICARQRPFFLRYTWARGVRRTASINRLAGKKGAAAYNVSRVQLPVERSSQIHRRRRRSKSMHELMLQCEVLEQRVVMSTFTWTGSGANANWSTVGNWSGGVAPTSGNNTLIFGAGQSQLTSVDDISALSVNEITLSGGYTVSGNAITLTGSGGVGIDNQAGTNAFSDPITLGTDLTFTEDAGQLPLGGVISWITEPDSERIGVPGPWRCEYLHRRHHDRRRHDQYFGRQ